MDLAVSNQEVSNVFDKIWHILLTIVNAMASAISDIPTIVLGWIFVILLCIMIYKRITR